MPMLDLFVPDGALAEDREKELVSKLTDILLRWEGADPANAFARSIAWTWVHRPATVFTGGERSDVPRYKVVATVPEGQLDDERRAGLVKEITEAVLDAEDGAHPRDVFRVWVFTNEVPDGSWGGAGRIFRLADIAGFVLSDPEAGRLHAKKRLVAARAERQALPD
jgi:phenylpyruvate tautomerase PptA (4-oxalocrotonate tautomerase family)